MRMLKASGATQDAIRHANRWNCDVCAARRAPKHPQAATPAVRPYGFNKVLHIDLKYLYDVRKKKYACLSILDLGTVKHQATMIKTRRSDYVATKFLKHWIMLFGVPEKVVHDQGGEFEQSFALLMEQFSIPTEVTAAHAGWQLSAGERHGGILGVMVQAVVDEHQVEGYRGMRLALAAATAAKNATISREGFTPDQRVFGKECVWPSLTDEDEKMGFAEGLSTESEVARAHRMRTSARISLLRQDVREKLRRAILRKPAAAVVEYVPGAQIYFWTPMRDKARYRTGGEWRGPATVLVKEKSKRYFCSWRGRLLLLAPENMRMATREEMSMSETVKDEVADLGDMLRDPTKSNVFQDLRGPPPPRRRRVVRRRVVQPREEPAGEDKEKRAREVEEEAPERKRAKLMMKGTKTVRKILQDRVQRMIQMGVVRRQQPRPRRMKALAAPAPQPPAAPEQVASEGERRLAIEDGEIPEEVVDAILEPNQHEEEWRQRLQEMTRDERRQLSLDDYPFPRKRGPEDEIESPDLKRRRIGESLVAGIRDVYYEQGGDPGRANEWISRFELGLLRRLTGLPVTAARLHNEPREKFQRPPRRSGKMVSRARTSILIGPNGRDAYVVEETAQEVSRFPARRAPMEWKGMTIFYKEDEEEKPTQSKVYMEMKDGLYEVPMSQKEKEIFEGLWLEDVKDILMAEVLVLKFRQNGKELDPKWFDESEKKAFRDSDAKEWSSWIENKVVRRVPRSEEKDVPRQHIFRAPLRMVRTNKTGALLLPLVAKSRLVVPGHRDPHLGQFRTDSPTASLVAVRLTKAIAVARKWNFHCFDITTAFLSGEATQRNIYVRGPPEGLPAAAGEPKIEGGALFQILKSAYGLTESPRLWYMKAKKDLEDTELKEIPASKSIFVAAEAGKSWAILALHVDDGLLVGDDRDPRFRALKKKIDGKFRIKEWKTLPFTYLGVRMRSENGGVYDDMSEYIKEIKVPEVTIGDPAAPLTAHQLTCFRQLVMRLRWPAQLSMPHMLYEVSALAQKVSRATGADFKEAVKLHRKFVSEAEVGRAALYYPQQDGDFYLTSFFDASLGKEEDSKSQLGVVHFLTTTGAKVGPCRASAVEFSTTKSSRVLRSSMAAESCAMTIAVDRHLYARLLTDVLQYGVSPLKEDWREGLRTGGGCVTDAKSLYDHLQTTGQVPTERQTMLDLLVCKDMLEQGHFDLWWVPTHRQHADGLTKKMHNVLWEQFHATAHISLKETAEEAALEDHRRGLRQAQRQRRKTKFQDRQSR